MAAIVTVTADALPVEVYLIPMEDGQPAAAETQRAQIAPGDDQTFEVSSTQSLKINEMAEEA